MLVIGRLAQGAMSGPMVPMSQALLLRSYPPDKRGLAMGLWAMVVFVGPIFGPIVGGWITGNFSWPCIFFINGAIAGLLVWIILRRRDSKRVRVPIDAVGRGLLVIGVGALQYMFDNDNDKDWFNSNIIVIVFGFTMRWQSTMNQTVSFWQMV